MYFRRERSLRDVLPLVPLLSELHPSASELEAWFQPKTPPKLHHGHRTMLFLRNHNEHERPQTMRELQVSMLIVSPNFHFVSHTIPDRFRVVHYCVSPSIHD